MRRRLDLVFVSGRPRGGNLAVFRHVAGVRLAAAATRILPMASIEPSK